MYKLELAIKTPNNGYLVLFNTTVLLVGPLFLTFFNLSCSEIGALGLFELILE